jgi:hypothetical protein
MMDFVVCTAVAVAISSNEFGDSGFSSWGQDCPPALIQPPSNPRPPAKNTGLGNSKYIFAPDEPIVSAKLCKNNPKAKGCDNG